jgi:hypothetical protein
MRGKIVLGVVLCLTVVALLGVGAAPAAAQGSCDCHTAVPPTNGAPAAHAPFVASVTDCTTCHKDMSPHPTSYINIVRLWLRGPSTLTGDFFFMTSPPPDIIMHGIPNAVVYLQQRLWGATEFTDLGQVTTRADSPATAGKFTYAVPSPTPWAAYRAIGEGGSANLGTDYPKVYMPVKAVWRPTPRLTLKLINVVNGVVPALGAPTFRGSARPLKLAGEKVNLPVYKWRAATKRWVKVRTGRAVISATGTYAWNFWWSQGFGPGSYRVRAVIAGTVNHTSVWTTLRFFKAK